jgi:hypothetical protein
MTRVVELRVEVGRISALYLRSPGLCFRSQNRVFSGLSLCFSLFLQADTRLIERESDCCGRRSSSELYG